MRDVPTTCGDRAQSRTRATRGTPVRCGWQRHHSHALRTLSTSCTGGSVVKIITYHITLLEPTLVTALEGDPNSAVAFPYLPGSTLRGAVIGKYLRHEQLRQLDSTDEQVRRLFFDATTRYLNGYPLDQQGSRT